MYFETVLNLLFLCLFVFEKEMQPLITVYIYFCTKILKLILYERLTMKMKNEIRKNEIRKGYAGKMYFETVLNLLFLCLFVFEKEMQPLITVYIYFCTKILKLILYERLTIDRVNS